MKSPFSSFTPKRVLFLMLFILVTDLSVPLLIFPQFCINDEYEYQNRNLHSFNCFKFYPYFYSCQKLVILKISFPTTKMVHPPNEEITQQPSFLAFFQLHTQRGFSRLLTFLPCSQSIVFSALFHIFCVSYKLGVF